MTLSTEQFIEKFVAVEWSEWQMGLTRSTRKDFEGALRRAIKHGLSLALEAVTDADKDLCVTGTDAGARAASISNSARERHLAAISEILKSLV